MGYFEVEIFDRKTLHDWHITLINPFLTSVHPLPLFILPPSCPRAFVCDIPLGGGFGETALPFFLSVYLVFSVVNIPLLRSLCSFAAKKKKPRITPITTDQERLISHEDSKTRRVPMLHDDCELTNLSESYRSVVFGLD